MKVPVILTILFFLFGCATKEIAPPNDIELTELTAKDINIEERYAYIYFIGEEKLAKKIEDSGCAQFKQLKDDDNFPLKVLAEIKFYLSCPTSKAELIAFWSEKNGKIPKWAEEFYVESSLKLAKDYQILNKEAELSYELSKYKSLKSEKIPLIQHAIKLASLKEKDEYQKELEKIAPRYIKKVTEESYIEVAKDFEKIREFNKARKYYRKVIRNKNAEERDKLIAWKNYCLTHKLERDNENYVKCFGRQVADLKKELTNKNELYDRMISYARALWTINRIKESSDMLLEILNFEDLSDEHTALTHKALAGIALEEKNLQKAIAHIKLALTAINITKDTKEELLWQLGWTYYISEHYKKAIGSLQELQNITQNTFTKERIQFWIGKIYQKQNNSALATEEFENLISKDGFGYYGLMALKELKLPIKPLKEFKHFSDYQGPNTLEWLIYTREWDIAKRYLRFMSYQDSDKNTIEEQLPLYHKGKAYDYGIFQFYKIESEKRNKSLKKFASLVFPMPFDKQIDEASRQFDIKKEYVYSIIRQESAFNKNARSYADAFGLMQVIPQKAEMLSKKLNIPYEELDDLYDPAVNVPIGTAILKDNLSRYNGNFVASTASYNAGDIPVQRWFKDRFNGDYLEFIEMIPYEETRSYVRLVMRNYLNYKRFTEQKPFMITDDIFTNF